MIIHPYRPGSHGVRELKQQLLARGVNVLVTQRPPRREGTWIVYWGKGDQMVGRVKVLNPPDKTILFVNKKVFFEQAAGTHVPPTTTDPSIAREWGTIVARATLNGTNGDGITIHQKGDELPVVPLYVEYKKKEAEYRVHVFRGKDGAYFVGHHQRKVARDPSAVQNWKVRNHDNGFFYQQHGYELPPVVSQAALELIETRFSGIDFVALDIIYNRRADTAWVLEGNTAPGLEGHTAEVYADFIKERIT